jgi:hypothetical protein
LLAALPPILTCAAVAEARKFGIGDLTLDVDLSRWQVERRGGDELVLEPTGEAVEKVNPLSVRHIAVDGGATCEGLAHEALDAKLYVEIQASAAVTAQLPAVRFESRTRCRNATPKGIVICVKYGGALYLFISRIADCQSAPPIGPLAENPLAEILEGASFAQ